MNCPNCHGPLVAVRYEGVAIQACQTRAGHWLDLEELDEIVRLTRGEIQRRGTPCFGRDSPN
jgi:Zn-finger nucleic acid-binding protein